MLWTSGWDHRACPLYERFFSDIVIMIITTGSPRGWHSTTVCTPSGQNFDRKKFMMAFCFAIVCFIAEILLDLDQLGHVYQRDSVA